MICLSRCRPTMVAVGDSERTIYKKNRMKNEIWNVIPGYDGVYQVSSYGRIKSLQRIDCGGRKRKEKILSQSTVRRYRVVGLNHNHVNKQYKVHRLVALAFLPNKENLPCINHKDENPLNNFVENLEWCTVEYNNKYGTAPERRSKSQSKTMKGRMPHPEQQKSVLQIDAITNNIIRIYKSLSEAARENNLSEGKISMVCNGKRNSHGGYKWKFTN